MFGNAYQNGPTLQVWDAKVNVDKNPFYKQLFRLLPNTICKYFDKEVKSYLYMIQNQNMRMNLPADDSKLLSLHQRYLVLHIFIPIGFSWSLEFTMSDLNGIKRRVNITTTQGKQQIKYFSFRYPIQNLKKGCWLFLGIDIYSFMGVFKDQTFRSLDQICISNSCRLRRIFTMKEFVQFEIPKNYWLCQSIPQEFQLIEHIGGIKEIGEMYKLQSISPKQFQNNSSPAKNIKKDYSPKINKSQLNGSRKIIQNARSRIQSLNRQQQKLINKSKELQANLSIKVSKEKYTIKVQQQKQKKTAQLSHSKIIKNRQKLPISSSIPRKSEEIKLNSNKLPQIDISFKQDSALNIEYDQSSNFTQQHMKTFTPKTPKDYQTKQVINQDRWSQQDHQPSRPISPVFSHMTGNFPSTIITKQNNKEIVVNKTNKKQLQLIYDEMVGCYYHPETNSYYELKH